MIDATKLNQSPGPNSNIKEIKINNPTHIAHLYQRDALDLENIRCLSQSFVTGKLSSIAFLNICAAFRDRRGHYSSIQSSKASKFCFDTVACIASQKQ